jgi:fructokinase
MLDVVCFGEILWDIFEVGPRAGVPFAGALRAEVGGAPANTATGLARLGCRAAVVGAVGRDRLGEALVAHLARDGVDVRFVKRLRKRTGLTFVAPGAGGEAAFLPYRFGTADGAITAADVTPAMARARWVVVGSGTLTTPGLAAATARLLGAADRAGACVLVELNVRPHLWPSRTAMRNAIADLAARATVIKASDADLRALGGGGRRGAAYGWLARHAPGATWLVTRGASLASAVGEHGEVSVAPRPVRCVDATGAGDAFLAGALAALVAQGATPGSSAWKDPRFWTSVLRIGHMMGMKAVSRRGAVAGLVRLGPARAAVDALRRSFA